MVPNYKWNFLKQENVTFSHKTILNVYIVEINLWSFNLGANFTLGNSSFGAVKLTRNADRGILILDMIIDLTNAEVFHCQMVVGLVKM